MTGYLIDDDPDTAYEHAKAARRTAARVASVREACGLAAYAAGHYAEALTELRTARRMSGLQTHLPVMADCERGLGRPERALALASSADVAALDPEGRLEMRIVASGARRDLGQFDAAVLTLQVRELDAPDVHPWTPRLRYAYADALLSAGRTDEAIDWFRRAADADPEGATDAEERLDELEATIVPAEPAREPVLEEPADAAEPFPSGAPPPAYGTSLFRAPEPDDAPGPVDTTDSGDSDDSGDAGDAGDAPAH
jgi:tetratricopeptide (TPR) repeat protein